MRFLGILAQEIERVKFERKARRRAGREVRRREPIRTKIQKKEKIIEKNERKGNSDKNKPIICDDNIREKEVKYKKKNISLQDRLNDKM